MVSHERAQDERRADIWRRKTVPAKVGRAVGSIVWHLESSARDCVERGSSAQYPNRQATAAHMTHATLLSAAHMMRARTETVVLSPPAARTCACTGSGTGQCRALRAVRRVLYSQVGQPKCCWERCAPRKRAPIAPHHATRAGVVARAHLRANLEGQLSGAARATVRSRPARRGHRHASWPLSPQTRRHGPPGRAPAAAHAGAKTKENAIERRVCVGCVRTALTDSPLSTLSREREVAAQQRPAVLFT